jgi:hypothetical protein
MVMTNRDRVDRGMVCLASGLGPFVSRRMAAALPQGSDWVTALAARNPSRYSAGQRYSPSDPRFLLRVVTEEWRVFKDQLSRVEHGYATELRDAGNRWAHGDPFSGEDTYRTLDTMERLLTAVGAAGQASQVRRLRLDLQQPAGGATPPSAEAHVPRPAGPAQRQSQRTAGFWSAVGHAHVVRAIEEYDRLGQEQFLAEHGFGRATAYQLIYRGRSYDSKAILGVAYQCATGEQIGPHDFSGGVSGAAGVLRNLGFEVRDTRTPADPGAQDQATAAGTPAGRVEDSVRAAVSPGDVLPTPSGRGHFTVARYTANGLVLLLGEKEAWTPLPWRALEEIPDFLRGRGWVPIGSAYSTGSLEGSLDEHLKQYLKRATAGWVAILLEKADVISVDRSRPAHIRLRPGW